MRVVKCRMLEAKGVNEVSTHESNSGGPAWGVTA